MHFTANALASSVSRTCKYSFQTSSTVLGSVAIMARNKDELQFDKLWAVVRSHDESFPTPFKGRATKTSKTCEVKHKHPSMKEDARDWLGPLQFDARTQGT